jgi:hypothetical protein
LPTSPITISQKITKAAKVGDDEKASDLPVVTTLAPRTASWRHFQRGLWVRGAEQLLASAPFAQVDRNVVAVVVVGPKLLYDTVA